jgi:hypothetical protein
LSPTYTYITLGTAAQQLANRLYDSAQVSWPAAELGRYIVEALRTWNALTSFWRGDFLFTPSQGVAFYDMTSVAAMPNSLRLFTLNDTDLYPSLQTRLLEPVAWNPWTGVSAQFTADDLLNALSRRRDEILSVTGCQIKRRLVPAVAGRITLPDTAIDIRRVAYLPAVVIPGVNTAASVLWPEDAWAEQSFNRNWTLQAAGTPFAYLASTEPPISFDTDRPPGFAGSYECLTIESGPALSIATPALVGIPDDWTWVASFGVLADLLSRDSLAADPFRADYANRRYRMGLAALDAAPSILAARINNVPMQVDSVRAADLFNRNWEAAQHPPATLLTAGLNLVALAPIPDAGAYSVTLTVVENAPVPPTSADQIQLSRGDLDVILDYAEHLALFRSGGAEFSASMPLLARFLAQCAAQNSKLMEIAEFSQLLYSLGREEIRLNPRYAESPAVAEPATEIAQ